MKVEFNVKYGKNIIEIPVTEKTVPKFQNNGPTDFFTSKVTIYNDFFDGETRKFARFVIDKCQITDQLSEKNDLTVRKVVNADTVTTKDVAHYKSPVEYVKLAESDRCKYYTAQPGDFVVLGEVEDIVSNVAEFAQMQKKYKNSGIKIASVSANIHGMAVDNVTIANV